MQKADCFYLGRIVKKHSFKGEVVIKCDEDFVDIIQKLESIWLDTKNHLVPFFIDNSRMTGPVFFRLKLDGVDTEQEAQNLVGSDVYLPKADAPEGFGDELLKQDLIGYTIVDKTYGKVGRVTFVNDATPQILLEVDNAQKTFFIPLHDDFVLDFDMDNRRITLDLPEGLLDL